MRFFKTFKTKKDEIKDELIEMQRTVLEKDRELLVEQSKLISLLDKKNKLQNDIIEDLHRLIEFYKKDQAEKDERIEDLEEIVERSLCVEFTAEDESEDVAGEDDDDDIPF